MYFYKHDKSLDENFKNLLADYNRLSANMINSDLTTDLNKEKSQREYEIECLIRERYSLSQELALLRKASLGIDSNGEIEEYNKYILECIKEVEKKGE